jgi:hypothetical protein
MNQMPRTLPIGGPIIKAFITSYGQLFCFNVDSIVLCHTMIACSKANQWEASFTLLRLYDSQTEVSIIAVNSLIASCSRSHRCDVAIDILNNEIPFYGLQPDLFSYRNAIIACNQAKPLEILLIFLLIM